MVPVITPVAGTLVNVFFCVVVVAGSWLLEALGIGRISVGVGVDVGVGMGVGVEGGVVIGLVVF